MMNKKDANITPEQNSITRAEIKKIAYEYGNIFEGATGVAPKCDMISLENLYNYTTAILEASENHSNQLEYSLE